MRKGINEIIAKNMRGEYLSENKVLKTILDKNSMDRLFDKMNNRFENSNNMDNRGTTIDFTTGKPKDMRESIIVIGIPYESRVKEDMKPFLNFIWSLEKGEILNSGKDKPELIDDTNIDPTQAGEIYKILTKQNETISQPVIDEGSTSLRNHTRAVEALLCESL
jgi:hypothetical protein